MKLAFYHPWLKSKGGVERLLFEYADRSVHDVDIITHHQEGTFSNYNTEPIELSDTSMPSGFIKKGAFTGYKILLSKLNLSDYDAFLVSESGIGCLVTLRNYINPTICYCHTPLRAAHHFYHDYSQSYDFLSRQIFKIAVHSYLMLERQAWNKFDSIICNSRNTLQTVESAGLARQKPKSVIYPGVDIKKFKNSSKGDYFLYPSRFKEYKRQELAINAFKEFKKEYGGEKRLILAGFPDDKEYLKEIQALADDDIEIKTDINDEELVDLYANSFAVLFTAKKEDWGIIPIEAMASGKPVIAVNEGGPTESIEDGKNGFLVDASAEKIAMSMSKLVKNEEQYEKMSEKAVQRSKEFSWSTFTKKMDREVEKSVNQH
ncbi:MAG: glycosyltransferase [Halobacteriaceae archaeon]